MTSGRFVVIAIFAIAILGGVGMWYAQTQAWYETISDPDLALITPNGMTPIAVSDFQAINAYTSPLRYRACFVVTDGGQSALAALPDYANPTPLTAPGWFDCFDAPDIGAALETGAARAVLAEHEIQRGVDRVIAVFPDGRGYAWHQLNGTLE
jgi:hypothetical protein